MSLIRLGQRSLRRTGLLMGLGFFASVTLGVGAVIWVQTTMSTRMQRATDAFLQEQRIANQITQAVTSQLTSAALYAAHRSPRHLEDFRVAGDRAYAQIRRYLFRELTTEQRLQLEQVKEGHQRLEVAAIQALELSRPLGEGRNDLATTELMARQAGGLQAALNAFLEMRELDLERLRANQRSLLTRVTTAAVGLSSFLIVLVLALGGIIHKRFTRPLENLGTAAKRLGEGDFRARIPVPPEKELAALAGSFNEMASRLERTHAELADRNHRLETTLDRLKETQDELIHTEKLSAVGQMLAGLAHELNNPLASVLGYGELLAEEISHSCQDKGGMELGMEHAQTLVSEARRARDLVTNLLHFSRKSEKRSPYASLRETMDVVKRLRRYSFFQAGARLEVATPPNVTVRADSLRLQQVFMNIINNAYYALRNQEGGELCVTSVLNGDEVIICFEDDGPGFTAPERALEPFYTTKPPDSGTGLGLTLANRFMEEWGGRMRVENRETGGARVQLALAVESTTQPVEGQLPRPAPGEIFDGVAGGGARILIVEDEAPLRRLHSRILGRLDAEVTTADSGREAIEYLEESDVDLVISDVKMPGAVSGLDLLDWIRSERPSLERAFILVTGDVADPRIEDFAQKNPGHVIMKPFDVSDYLRRVTSLLPHRGGSSPG